MRIAFVLILVLVSGCAGQAPQAAIGNEETASADATVQPDWVVAYESREAMAGTFEWHTGHMTGDSVDAAIHATMLGLHAVTSICITTEGDPYVSNLHLTDGRIAAAMAPGTTHLQVELTWTLDDYAHDTLFILYKPASYQDMFISEAMRNGLSGHIPIPADAQAAGINLWVCLDNDDATFPLDSGYTLRPFLGNLDVQMDWVQR